jgi:hypothetical protein
VVVADVVSAAEAPVAKMARAAKMAVKRILQTKRRLEGEEVASWNCYWGNRRVENAHFIPRVELFGQTELQKRA